ncbi:MAG: AsmA family protein, partial [Dokdonia donghaensis]|nr:AsmA family protein [Dokdonia donghaensis]
QPLQGRLVADVVTSFDMNAVEKQQYQNIKSSGNATLSDFTYSTPQLPNPIAIQNADVSFKTGNIALNSFAATSGSSDINATGSIENLIPFVMSKEDLKGHFDVTSKVFNLDDFATSTATTTGNSPASTGESNTAIQIPDFLDASVNFNAAKVIYDGLELSNTKGSVTIANEQASLSNLNSGIFGGAAGLSGSVTTRDGAPTFNMTVDLSSIDIDRSFKELEMLQGLAPIAKALQGALNTKIQLQGQLDDNFSPILSTISGDAFAEILTADVDADKMPLLNLLSQKLDFINLDDLKLDKLKTSLTFNDGQVAVKPFDFNIKGINVQVSGGHSFTNEMNYTLNLDLPAKYLGGDVSGLLSKLTDAEKENIHIDVPVSLSGNFIAPKVDLNLKAATTALTNQIIEIQKQRAKDKVEDKLTDVLGGLLGGNKTTPNTTATDSTTTDTQTPQNTTTTQKPKTPLKMLPREF